MGKYDALRAEFVAGVMSVAQLAERHGESYDALRQAAARGSWRRLRHEYAQDMTREARARAVATCAAQCEADIAAAEKLRAAVQKRLDLADELPLQDLRHCAATLTDAQKLWRTALGVEGAPLELQSEWTRHTAGMQILSVLEEGDDIAAEIQHEMRERGITGRNATLALPYIMGALTDSEKEEIKAGRGTVALREAMRTGLQALYDAAKAQEATEGA